MAARQSAEELDKPQHGLTTKVALRRLHEEIERVLLEHERLGGAER